MRWLIVGAAGQLGNELIRILGTGAIPVTRAEADLASPEQLSELAMRERPDGVINCAAYNLVDKAEEAPREAFTANCWGAGNLGALCANLEIPLVHLSTDHVFGGHPPTFPDETPRPWVETDAPAPAGVYALSKLAGEHLARIRNPLTWVIRTCGLYGARGAGGKGTNFVETMLRLAREGKSLRVVSDQICTPTPVRDLAPAILALVEGMPPGLYHLTSAGNCSWHEFAQAIFAETQTVVEVQPITSQQFGAKAQRPKWSVLGSMFQDSAQMPRLRHWREGLASYLHEERQGR